jgi:hypothetical protein
MRVFYFGVWPNNRGTVGHWLHKTDGSNVRDNLPFAWKRVLDAGLLPGGEPQTEGLIYPVDFLGWTVLTFWDRSGDSRPNSNSAFVIERPKGATLRTREQDLALCRERFPAVFERIKFPLVFAGDASPV